MLRDALPEIHTKLPGPKSAAVIARREAVVPSAIHCGYPVVMKRAEGAIIEDLDGNHFLDWIGGVGVLTEGSAGALADSAGQALGAQGLSGLLRALEPGAATELEQRRVVAPGGVLTDGVL